jgi:hypothetical protein
MGFTDAGLERGDYPRACDICGHRFRFKQLKHIGQLRWACPDDARGLTEIQISKHNAKARPVRIRPHRHVKDATQTPVYQMEEAATFNYIAATAPYQNAAVAVTSARATAWAALYMSMVILDGRRPSEWIARATELLRTYLTYLGSVQYTTSEADPRYGAFLESSGYSTDTAIVGGLAYLKAYQALDSTDYLESARRVATYLRRAQSGDKQVTKFTVYPQGGGAYHVGGLASGVVDATQLLTAYYFLGDVLGLWFLDELKDEIGDLTFGDAVATAYFSANSAALSTMISELEAFAETGAKDSAQSGEEVSGLSATAPRATYLAARNGEADAPGWISSVSVSSDSICAALRGLHEVDSSNATVTTMLAWLHAVGANSANATTTQRDSLVFLGYTGVYDPAICPATILTAAAPFTEVTGAVYAWGSLGLLAPILTAADSGAFRVSKDAFALARRVSMSAPDAKYIGPLGQAGLSYQVYGIQGDVVRAAKAALVYREAPGHYPQVAQ